MVSIKKSEGAPSFARFVRKGGIPRNHPAKDCLEDVAEGLKATEGDCLPRRHVRLLMRVITRPHQRSRFNVLESKLQRFFFQ